MSEVTRRDFIVQSARLAALAAVLPAGLSAAQDAGRAADGLVWHKAPCRFCGTGCGAIVGVKDGRVAAVQGDAACAGRVDLAGGDSMPRAARHDDAGATDVADRTAEHLNVLAALNGECIPSSRLEDEPLEPHMGRATHGHERR